MTIGRKPYLRFEVNSNKEPGAEFKGSWGKTGIAPSKLGNGGRDVGNNSETFQ